MNPDTARANAMITVRNYRPVTYHQPSEGPALSRIHVEETFNGDIEASGVVDFIQSANADGSASFVGIERVDGKLAGKRGTFLLQDTGTLPATWFPASGSWCPAPAPGSWPAFAAAEASAPTLAKAPRCTLTTGSSKARARLHAPAFEVDGTTVETSASGDGGLQRASRRSNPVETGSLHDNAPSTDATNGNECVRLAVVVPVYNEAHNIAELVARLAETSKRCNATIVMLVVDDGSTDASLTSAAAELHRLPGSRVVELSRNFGKEAALLAGMDAALAMGFDALVLMDADLQHPPEAIPAMLAKWRTGVVDVVIAVRRSRADDPAARRVLSKAFYRIINSLADVPIPDGDGDFRLLSRDVVRTLCSLREQDRFTKGLYSWIGFRQQRILVDFDARRTGKSRFGFRKLASLAGNALTSFSSRPLRLSLYVGAMIGTVSVLLGVWIVAHTLVFGRRTPGFASTFCGMMFLGGIQLATIGLLGEYVGKTYMQSKNRPPYVTRSVIHIDHKQDAA